MDKQNGALVKALVQRERDYASSIDLLRDRVENDLEAFDATIALREATELVRCLRRLVPTCSVDDIHRAFGAPGDFGYDTPIGDALSALYRGS